MNPVTELNKRSKDVVQDGLIEMAKNGPKTYIFNTFNLEHVRRLGSLGIYVIPGVDTHGSDRPEDWEPYSRPLVIDAWTIETYDKGEGQFGVTPWEAKLVVADVLGIPEGDRRNDLRNYGVFATANKVPTKAELESAKKLLVKRMAEDVKLGDDLYGGDAKQRARINHIHRRAARYLGVQRDWSAEVLAAATCPFCESHIQPGAAFCTACHNVLDQAKFDAAKARAAGNQAQGQTKKQG